MRTDAEMLDLILAAARADERIRAVILNGSRANPNARRDPFQDFDIVYLVTQVEPFKRSRDWLLPFGPLMILQTPDEMGAAPPGGRIRYAYLVQFSDGCRIDFTFHPLDRLDALPDDSLSVLLLDKDGVVPPFAPASERGCLPQPPSAKAFGDCCNEFWWVSTYVAKGLWRGEITYAKYFMDQTVREELIEDAHLADRRADRLRPQPRQVRQTLRRLPAGGDVAAAALHLLRRGRGAQLAGAVCARRAVPPRRPDRGRAFPF